MAKISLTGAVLHAKLASDSCKRLEELQKLTKKLRKYAREFGINPRDFNTIGTMDRAAAALYKTMDSVESQRQHKNLQKILQDFISIGYNGVKYAELV